MRSVGAQQLGRSLPEYLRLVESGETVRVTDRSRVIAELRPVPASSAEPSGVEARLQSLAQSGDVTRAARSKEGWTWRVKGQGMPDGSASKLLDELRSDR